jgi:putative oxidoreductase
MQLDLGPAMRRRGDTAMTTAASKAASLLLLRAGTGLLLVVWGALRVMTPAAGPGLATKYYGGFLDLQSLQVSFGVAEMAIGLLVALGLFRRFVYLLQALILIPGALVLWRFLLDPLGLYLLDKESSQILFFPSVTVAAATLVLLAFRTEDRWSLDHQLMARGKAE